MGLIISEYDQELLIDKSWYDSSNIYYSECYDKKNELKDLKVVFNDGRSYLYKDVSVVDILLFKNGGVNNSQGKALFKYIACKVRGVDKYQYEKLDSVDIKVLEEQKKVLLENKNAEI